MPTPTLYKFISSELHRVTPDEMVDDDGNLVFFDSDFQIMPKILDFDNDVQDITDNLFNGLSLDDPIHDEHFKKTFLFRFMNRQINRQTIEAFKFELMNTFLTSQSYINRVYQDAEKYILQYSETEGTSKELSNEISKMVNEQITEQLDRREQEERNSSQSKQNTTSDSEENSKQDSKQTADGRTDTDNRSARSDLPQNTVNLNLDNRTMSTANENEISRNRTDDNRTTDTTTDTDTSGNSTGEMTNESSGESSGESTGETSTDTKGKSDTERDATRDGRTTGSQISYSLDELFKSTGLMEGIFNTFDRKCFLQTW